MNKLIDQIGDRVQNNIIKVNSNENGPNRYLRKNKRQIQAIQLASLGDLAGSIAHEINNPLTGVLLYTKLLYKKISNESISKDLALDYLSKMDTELTRVTELIRELKDFALQSELTSTQLDINEVIERALDYVTNSVGLSHIQVLKKLDPSLPKVMGDFEQLYRVCTNLILNGIQAMPTRGQLVLRTSLKCNQLRIEIHDTGCGISQENMANLFKPFFSTKPKVKGIGLGLAVAYGIVRRHAGNIEVRSQVGKGSTFTVYLPVHNADSLVCEKQALKTCSLYCSKP